MYVHVYIYSNLPRNVILRLSHPRTKIARRPGNVFSTLLTSEPATMPQIAQTTIPPNHLKALGLNHPNLPKYVYIILYICI